MCITKTIRTSGMNHTFVVSSCGDDVAAHNTRRVEDLSHLEVIELVAACAVDLFIEQDVEQLIILVHVDSPICRCQPLNQVPTHHPLVSLVVDVKLRILP